MEGPIEPTREQEMNPIELSQELLDKLDRELGASAEPYPNEERPYNGAEKSTSCAIWRLDLKFPRYDKSRGDQEIDLILDRVRRLIGPEDALAYKRISFFINAYKTASNEIVVCPSKDPYRILEYEWGLNSAHGAEYDYFIDGLEFLDQQFGIDITGAGYQTIEFVLKRLPSEEEASSLKDHLRRFCPDFLTLLYDSFNETIDFDLVSQDELLQMYEFSDGRIVLWWD